MGCSLNSLLQCLWLKKSYLENAFLITVFAYWYCLKQYYINFSKQLFWKLFFFSRLKKAQAIVNRPNGFCINGCWIRISVKANRLLHILFHLFFADKILVIPFLVDGNAWFWTNLFSFLFISCVSHWHLQNSNNRILFG